MCWALEGGVRSDVRTVSGGGGESQPGRSRLLAWLRPWTVRQSALWFLLRAAATGSVAAGPWQSLAFSPDLQSPIQLASLWVTPVGFIVFVWGWKELIFFFFLATTCHSCSVWDLVPCVCMGTKSLSHVWLFATPWTAARQAPLSMEFSRQDYWSGVPFPPPGDLPDPGIKPASLTSPALAGEFLTASATWEALNFLTRNQTQAPCIWSVEP